MMAKVVFSFHNNFVTDKRVVMKFCTLLHMMLAWNIMHFLVLRDKDTGE